MDGTTAAGVRFLVDDPYKRDQAPTFGLYLDQCWAPPWDHAHLRWVDFGVPDAPELRVESDEQRAFVAAFHQEPNGGR